MKPETVALMSQNHIGDLSMGKMTTVAPMYTNDVDLYPDIVKKWGLCFLINTAKTPEGRSAGSLAWAGLANTYFWIDPARNVAGVILMQLLPFADGKALEAFAGFERGVYAGLGCRAEGGVRSMRPSLRAKRSNPSRHIKEEWIASSLALPGANASHLSQAMTDADIVPRSCMEQPI